MTQRVVLASAPRPRQAAPEVTVCDPAEAAARLVVIALIVYAALFYAIDYAWFQVGWIGWIGVVNTWQEALLAAGVFALLVWRTRLGPWKLAAAVGFVLLLLNLVLPLALAAVGVGRWPNPNKPVQILGPPVDALGGFAAALIAWRLAVLVGADRRVGERLIGQ